MFYTVKPAVTVMIVTSVLARSMLCLKGTSSVADRKTNVSVNVCAVTSAECSM